MNRVIEGHDLEGSPFSREDALEIYRDMVRARQFDERALALQRRGWMSGYPPFRGQEGSQVGAAHAMAEGDWLVPTYRSLAMEIARGVPMSDILVFRRGNAEFVSGHDLPLFPQAVPIATQIPHATGIGMAADYSGDDCAVLCYLGDGATSEGDFHEGLNFAGVVGRRPTARGTESHGVFDVPVVFLCENNGWAISVPRDRQTASATLAQKAEAYGFEGVQVDGNDPLAVAETVAEALESARGGDPVLIESLTYRQGAHTTSDDPSRYRDEPDLPDWRTADPLERYETFLRERGVLEDEVVESVREDADAEIEAAIDEAEDALAPEPGEVFEHVYEEVPPQLEAQRAWLEGFAADHDADDLEF